MLSGGQLHQGFRPVFPGDLDQAGALAGRASPVSTRTDGIAAAIACAQAADVALPYFYNHKLKSAGTPIAS